MPFGIRILSHSCFGEDRGKICVSLSITFSTGFLVLGPERTFNAVAETTAKLPLMTENAGLSFDCFAE